MEFRPFQAIIDTADNTVDSSAMPDACTYVLRAMTPYSLRVAESWNRYGPECQLEFTLTGYYPTFAVYVVLAGALTARPRCSEYFSH